MEDKITKLAVSEVSEYLDAPLGMESVSFTLIKEFPLATVQFNGLWLGSRLNESDSSAVQTIDTLARFDKLYVSVLSEPLLDNIFRVREIEVSGGYLKYEVDTAGVSCFDFLIAQDTTVATVEDTTSTALNFALKELTLKDLTCYYKDDLNKAEAKAYIQDIKGSAFLDSLRMDIVSEGIIQLTNCKFDDTNLYKMAQTDLDFSIKYISDSIAIEKLQINTEGAALGLNGTVVLREGGETDTDLAISATNFNVEELIKYAPQQYLTEYQLSQLAGILNLQADVKGIVSDTKLPLVNGKFDFSNGHVKWADYPAIDNFFIKGAATNGYLRTNASTSITIDTFNLTTNSDMLALKGSVSNIDHPEYDVITSLKAKLGNWKAYVPDSLVKDFDGYINLAMKTRGVLPDSITDDFTDYVLQNTQASLQFDSLNVDLDSSLSLQNLAGKLSYESNELLLDGFKIDLPQYDLSLKNESLRAIWEGSINKLDQLKLNLFVKNFSTPGLLMNGKVSVKNLNHPTFVVQDTFMVNLPKLKKFIPDSVLNDIDGNIYAFIHTQGTLNLDSISEQIMDIVYDNSTLYAEFEDISVDLPETDMDLKKLSAKVDVNPKKVSIYNLSGSYSDIPFKSDTTLITNLYNTILRDKPGKLQIEGIWRLEDLNYAELMETFVGSDSTSEESTSETEVVVGKDGNELEKEASWDMDYEVKGRIYVNSFQYNNALIEKITTKFKITPETYVFDQLFVNAFDGSMNSSMNIILREDTMKIDMRNQIYKMDIRKLLHDMDNFGQTDLMDKHLTGILSTEAFYTQFQMVGDSIYYPDMKVSGDFTLEKGGFYSYEPISSLAPLIPGVKSLDTLVFETIESHLFIFQDAIYVPKTSINTNAFSEISVVGMQSFGEDYTYRVAVRLRDFIIGKSKKDKDKKPKYLKATSIDGKSTNFFDNEENQELMGRDIRSKERLLKLRFYPSMFVFDTGVK